MKTLLYKVAFVMLAGVFCVPANGQDLYDTATLRSFNISFHDPDWLQQLRNNYASQTLILADLEIDGEVYPDVGVRIRGNTSYTALPFGSEKFSLKIKTDFVDPDQEVMGYDTINLNNSFRDPTFCREVVYNNFVAQYIPNPRANHALVTLNGQNWGVYINTQQPDKRMLRDFFSNADGLRIKCANNPFGPGLQYAGTNPNNYNDYEVQNDGGLADPLGALIEVCDAVTSGSLASWQSEIDSVFAVDPSIWSVVLENMLTDDDSYVNKGCDFMTYRDPNDGRMHLLQRDANETFTEAGWSVTLNFGASNKPVLSHLLDVPELRQRYMAHYRTAFDRMNWDYFGPRFTALRDQIDSHVQGDPKRLYSYDHFVDNFTQTVDLGPGFFGGNVVGLQQFIDQREANLSGHGEMTAAGPAIGEVAASVEAPDPSDPVWITAGVEPVDGPIEKVELFYRPTPAQTYQSVPMLDDGLSGDGDAGDGVYGVLLPVIAGGGQRVQWYVAATADNSFGSLSFSPALSERDPMVLAYVFGSDGGMRISEWAYSADSGEFVEFTNMTDSPIDMTGWSFDDSNAIAGAYDLSGFGLVAPGESVVLTESDAGAFRAAWGLDAGVKIVGDLGVNEGHNMGRNDSIVLFDSGGDVVDRLDYGDEDFPGTIRTRDASGQTCRESLGQNDVALWVLSEAGDEFGSFAASTGEAGTPGTYNAPSCAECIADINGDGEVNFFDLSAFLSAFSSMDPIADINGDGAFDFFDVSGFLGAYTAGCP